MDITPSPGLPNGDYWVIAVLDVDGSGPGFPTCGDECVFFTPLTVTGGAGTLTINEVQFVSHDLQVTVNHTGQDGKIVYMAIINRPDDCGDQSIAEGGGILAAGTLDLCFWNVSDGDRDACAFIDVDGSGPDSGPNSGDRWVEHPFTQAGVTTTIIPEDDFVTMP